MKLNKSTILILCLLLSASIAHTTERASISATATVIPSLGLMQTINKSIEQTGTSAMHSIFTRDNKLLIQAPKYSTLLIHIQNVNKRVRSTGLLTYESSVLSSTKKNSVSDIYSLDLSDTQSSQIITIITTDN